jgi:NAD(P)-dependent dehydrogenase (short-subunit alcohol dehydrogenase family)
MLVELISERGIKVTIVEPGYFRTDFLAANSLSVNPPRIDDYTTTAGVKQLRDFEALARHRTRGG